MYVCVRAYVSASVRERARARMCVCACVRACGVRACVRAYVCVGSDEKDAE